MINEVVGQLQGLGIDPKLVHRFLKENIQISEQLNNDLMAELAPLEHARNNLMLAHVQLLITLLDEYYQRQDMKLG